MTTLRNRRALSMRRRTGLQCEDYQTAMGRTPRHAQGWADLAPAPERKFDPEWIVGAVMAAASVGLALHGAAGLLDSVMGWIQ
jgi:hypothetical protein